jgi:hypothetical protein
MTKAATGCVPLEAATACGCTEMRLERDPPGGRRPLDGFGVQCDSYLYDAVNAAAGVGADDYALVERRLRALRPSLSRMFCHVDWFNPARDAKTYRWDLPGYANLLRMLRLLQEVGARVNLVLFQPFGGLSREQHGASVRAMADLLARLRDAEGIAAVRWLTLYNEPETVFTHDSPLMRRIFGDACVEAPPDWEMLVGLWRLAQARLEALGLYPHVKLAVPDCVYGSPVRYERMRLAAEAFAAADADFSVHVYSPEDPSGQPQTEAHRRDWGYPGMACEAADFRALAGPARRLILWEYNLEGLGGRTSLFPGVNRQGLGILETPDAGPEILEKTLLAALHGYDGACLWCLSDMLYCEDPGCAMAYGLWRFKNARWYPRPHYYYYAPLCQLFRAGMSLVPVAGGAPPLLAMAARNSAGTAAVILNRGEARQSVRLAGLPAKPVRRLRIHPGVLPATGGDLPLDTWEAAAADADGALRLDLLPREATYLSV